MISSSRFVDCAADAARFLVQGIWNKHVGDWSTLLFYRHGEYEPWDRGAPWDHKYVGGPLPIIENSSLSFINTGSDLIYAATQLFHLDADAEALAWAKRLLHRYDEIRHPDTRLGGYPFNHPDPKVFIARQR